MEVSLRKLEDTGYACDYKDCLKSEDTHYKILSSHFLKPGQMVATFNVKGYMSIYCENCITHVYNDIKSKLDKQLWPFK